jgi:enamine deaminase RidA (YjgF/YER057c/UK114 family)
LNPEPKVSRAIDPIATQWFAILPVTWQYYCGDYQSMLVVAGQIGLFDGSGMEVAATKAVNQCFAATLRT